MCKFIYQKFINTFQQVINILKQYKVATVSDSPLIKQYFEVKEKYPQTLLLFRVGDF
ncbi:MAG: hypothetical protein IIX29_01845, partial [Bacteroidales bacterium]|nr:hypothetical protein [Bacteroidales bacterium]